MITRQMTTKARIGIIIQTIRIKKYIELMLQITNYLEIIKPCINSNYNYFELDPS